MPCPDRSVPIILTVLARPPSHTDMPAESYPRYAMRESDSAISCAAGSAPAYAAIEHTRTVRDASI